MKPTFDKKKKIKKRKEKKKVDTFNRVTILHLHVMKK